MRSYTCNRSRDNQHANHCTPCFETCHCRLCCTGKAGRAAALASIPACSFPPSAVGLIGSSSPSASPTPQSGPSCHRRAPSGPAGGGREDSWAARQDACGNSCGAWHVMQSCAWSDRVQHSMALARGSICCEPAFSAAPQCSHAHKAASASPVSGGTPGMWCVGSAA